MEHMFGHAPALRFVEDQKTVAKGSFYSRGSIGGATKRQSSIMLNRAVSNLTTKLGTEDDEQETQGL